MISSVINLTKPNVKSELLACGSPKHVSTVPPVVSCFLFRVEFATESLQAFAALLLSAVQRCPLSTEEALERDADCRNDNKLDS